MPIETWSQGKFEDIAKDLQIDEEELGNAGIPTPEEAQARSDRAQYLFEAAVQSEWKQNAAKWSAEYAQLRQAGWPWRVAAYIAWASSPRKDRWPGTQEKLATEVLGLTSDRVIVIWRKKNAMIDETIAVLQAAPLFAHRRDVIEALVESATNPSYRSHNDRKLLLEMTGDFVPKSELKIRGKLKGRGLEERSDAELTEMAGAINDAAQVEGDDGSDD